MAERKRREITFDGKWENAGNVGVLAFSPGRRASKRTAAAAFRARKCQM